MARTIWASQTLSVDADLLLIEPNTASWGVVSLANKHTLAKAEIGRMLRLRLAEYKGSKDPVEEGADGATAAAGTTFTAAGSAFGTKKVNTAHRLWITSGDDKGVYTFTAVSGLTLTGCSPAFTATAGSLSYYIEPDVLDLIKNPTVLGPAAVFLVLHYAALELVQSLGDFWDARQEFYRKRFNETFTQLAADLQLDLNQDQVIGGSEKSAGITGGRLIR